MTDELIDTQKTTREQPILTLVALLRYDWISDSPYFT